MSQEFTVYQATNPATSPEALAEMARSRPDLRQFVAANPATPQHVVEWLGTLGDHAVDAALARRRPAAPAAPQSPAGPPAGGYGTGAAQDWSPTAPAAGAPGRTVVGSYAPPPQPLAGTNPYAPPETYGAGPAHGSGHAAPAPVTGLPQDAHGYRLPEAGGRRRTGLVVAIVVGVVLLLGALVFAASAIFGAIDTSATYGDDPDLDRLWDQCAAGSGQACDDLYMESPFGSEYEEFGDTCGSRRPPGEWCAGRI